MLSLCVLATSYEEEYKLAAVYVVIQSVLQYIPIPASFHYIPASLSAYHFSVL